MNLFSPQHRPRAFLRALVILGLAAATGSAAARPPSGAVTLAQQRIAFTAAYDAAQSGQPWRPLAKGLESYPLYSYLEAAALQHDIDTAPPDAIDAYLQHWPASIPADDLRKAELAELAQRKDWATFQRFYRPGLGDTLTCDALQAKLAQGQRLDFDRDLGALWQKTSLPSACAPVLDAAATQGLLTTTRVWERIERAADARSTATITQSAAWLPTADAAAAKRIAEALDSPSTLLAKAKTFVDTSRNREAIARAVDRLAHRDSAQSDADWQALSKRFTFDAAWRARVHGTLALYNAVDLGPDAVARLAALPAAAQTDATREWRVRIAVATGDWKAADAAIVALTPAQMQQDEWRYWHARIAQQLGRDADAQQGYDALARQATFYGFLAADRAHLPYSICTQTVAADPAALAQVEANPGLARAFEFFALGMLANGRREWSRAFADLAPAAQRQAAALASRKGWHDRPVFAFGGKPDDLHYYALRFPVADKARVVTSARVAGIDPAWAFAIIRAESAWQPDAHSGADARGLMQLQPATAKHVAQRNDLPYDGAASLYDPAINIPLGTQYLASLAARFDGSEWLASAAYNAGPGNARRWVGARDIADAEAFILAIPFNETRAYVTRVLSFATIYGWQLHGSPIRISTRMPPVGSTQALPADPPRAPVACRADAASPPATATTTGHPAP